MLNNSCDKLFAENKLFQVLTRVRLNIVSCYLLMFSICSMHVVSFRLQTKVHEIFDINLLKQRP